MKLNAVFFGSEESSLRERIVAWVVVLTTISGARGWMPVTGRLWAWYHAKTGGGEVLH